MRISNNPPIDYQRHLTERPLKITDLAISENIHVMKWNYNKLCVMKNRCQVTTALRHTQDVTFYFNV
jgi:hypothetical protein